MKASTLEKQAAMLAETLRRLGEPEQEVQRRVQRALASARNRTAKREPVVNQFWGCMSVTVTAKTLGVTRACLFSWLEHVGWLYRSPHGWRPTENALAAGWAVLRGRGAVQWAQLTPAGTSEVARRLGVAYGHSYD